MSIFVFPFPPSVNTLYFQAPGQGHNKKILTKKGREYKQRLLNLYADDYEPIKDYLSLHIYLMFPTTKEGDIDNYIKPIQDGLKWLGVIEDDKQIKEVSCISSGKSKFNRGVALIELVKSLSIAPILDDQVEYEMQKANFDAECMLEFHKPTKKELKLLGDKNK